MSWMSDTRFSREGRSRPGSLTAGGAGVKRTGGPAVSGGTALAQTSPAPQPLPYTQNFSALPPSSTVYPAGWQGWQISTSPGAAFSLVGPTADLALAPNGIASLNAGAIYNYDGKIG